MSFISILKKIGSVAVGVEHVAASTGLLALVPGGAAIDAIFQIIPTSAAQVEALNPVDKQGAVKEQVVIRDFELGLTATREILEANGKTLTYDQAALKEAIAGQVAAYNAMAKVKASFRIVDKT